MKKGFTLVELLVVVAIISVLTAITTSNLATSKAKSRDAKRVSDIAQLQLALELFFDRCNGYPDTLSLSAVSIPAGGSNTCPSGITLETFISKIPTAPAPSSYVYSIKDDKTDYVLRTTLETSSASLDRYTGSNSFNPAVTCGASTDYCMVPR